MQLIRHCSCRSSKIVDLTSLSCPISRNKQSLRRYVCFPWTSLRPCLCTFWLHCSRITVTGESSPKRIPNAFFWLSNSLWWTGEQKNRAGSKLILTYDSRFIKTMKMTKKPPVGCGILHVTVPSFLVPCTYIDALGICILQMERRKHEENMKKTWRKQEGILYQYCREGGQHHYLSPSTASDHGQRPLVQRFDDPATWFSDVRLQCSLKRVMYVCYRLADAAQDPEDIYRPPEVCVRHLQVAALRKTFLWNGHILLCPARRLLMMRGYQLGLAVMIN